MKKEESSLEIPDDIVVQTRFQPQSRLVIFAGDCLEFLRSIPDNSVQLVVTSPPYNIGKEYERKSTLADYLEWQRQVITESYRILKGTGSICWQVGNYVDKGSIVPLDVALYPIFDNLGMKLRNRIVWHFEHGLHASRRLSGRYETINWFTKSDDYYFDVNPIRVPQKYPGKKYYKGPRAGQYSSNPLGKNPGDLWTFPNVKNNHVEKTDHPCQFPVELVERLVLSLTQEDDWVVDPFLGVGSSVIAAFLHQRRGAGSDLSADYIKIANQRILKAKKGTLRVRAMNTPVYDPKDAGKSLTTAPWLQNATSEVVRTNGKIEHALQPKLLEKKASYKVAP